ncbi:MAG: hypothetical protein M3271_12005 [Actinomycetota bacterium]|nr:hypothetical protein [Actinomycetota bacterium]
MTRVGQMRRLRVSIAVAAALSLGAVTLLAQTGEPPPVFNSGTVDTAHKPGHPQPPGCQKAKVKYGKKPKKNCPNQT